MHDEWWSLFRTKKIGELMRNKFIWIILAFLLIVLISLIVLREKQIYASCRKTIDGREWRITFDQCIRIEHDVNNYFKIVNNQ